jgi:hypothetical protein
MKLALSVCVGLLLFLPSTSGATNDPPDIGYGNGLFSELSSCQRFGKEHPSEDDWRDCFEASGYIRGVIDALPAYRPDGVTYGQEFEIVYLYLKNHVNQRQRTSVSLIVDALVEAFPSPKAK